MLTSNQTFVTVRFLGGAVGGTVVPNKSPISNAMAFGQTNSVPTGYNDPSRSLVSNIKTGGQISARSQGESFLSSDLRAFGNMAGSMDGDADMIAAGNVLSNGFAVFAGDADMIADIRAIGIMSANMDILARPSAFDIAQEVWNSNSSAFITANTTGRVLNDTKKAARQAAALSA